ncbi:hypothetical protein [Hoylesella saccharolytica]|uniref:hypothetical protein n=1 Tax=Hoylesella saccharolytica TaxID=633701 RepID=UPI0028E594B9|nr:hypothetical protein [Hoylesella saccharolytica]
MKKTFTTSKQLFFAFCLAAGFALFAASCGNDADETGKGKDPTPPEELKDTATVVKAGDLTFVISEKPFDADIDTDTRAYEPPMVTDTIELADGVEAEITIERDKPAAGTRGPTPQIKHLPDGHYHIFAYQGGVRKGWLHFIVQGGKLNAWGKMMLPAGHYDLCCFNTKVTYPTDFSWFGMNIGNAGQELFGVAKNVYIGGPGYQVPISIGHHSARIRTKLIAMMDIPTDVRTKLYSKPNAAPENIVYRPATGNFETSGTTTINTVNTTAYTAAADVNVPGVGTMKTMLANDYQYVMAGTKPSDLIMHITNGGKLYTKLMYNFSHIGINSATQQFLSNRSYTISVKLLPNFKYVFQDGSRGYLRDKGNRIPVALVLTDHLGVALSDAAPPDYPLDFIPHWEEDKQPYDTEHDWYGLFSRTWVNNDPRYYMQDNESLPGKYWTDVLTQHTDGAFYTWNPDGSSGYRDGYKKTGNARIKGNNITDFPAFYWSDLHRKSLIKRFSDAGVTYYAPLFQQGQWFLPSVRQWLYVLDQVGMGNHDAFVQPDITDQLMYTSCYSNIINYAFTNAAGTPPLDTYHYWTCVEWDNYGVGGGIYCDCAYVVILNSGANNRFTFRADRKGCTGKDAQFYRVRSFVQF